MDKNNAIKILNEIKSEPLSQLKSESTKNSDGHNYEDLLKYNVMLDNIAFGCHTKHVIEYQGITWTFRPLTAEEFMSIKLDVYKIQKDNEMWDETYSLYLIILKTLSIALSPSPFKLGKDDKGDDLPNSTVFTENDLKKIPFDILQELYRHYLHFVSQATKNPLEFTNEELEILLKTIKKNSIPLTDLERKQLLMIAIYGMSCSQQLDEMLKSD